MEIIELGQSFIHLNNDGSVLTGTDRFNKGGYTLSSFHLTEYKQTHPDYWEWHPKGDELIFLLEGKMKVQIIADGVPDPSSVNANEITETIIGGGQAIIIPTAHWHRLLLLEESKIAVMAMYEDSKHFHVEESIK